MRRRRWLIEAPLGVASFGLNRWLHAKVTAAVTARARAVAEPAWSLLDGAMLQDDKALLAFSLRAPRWNPHAVIALSPVLRVRESLSIHAETAWAATERWTLVIYDATRAFATLGSAFTDRGSLWERATLPAGEYRVVLRMYDPGPGAVLPAVQVDGAPALAQRALPTDCNGVYRDLRQRATLQHKVLQGYTFPMVKLRGWLGEDRVDRHYLPVGNPETEYKYGAIERGDRLEVRQPDLPSGAGVYLCLYDRASFPMTYRRIDAPSVLTAPAEDDGTWLLRVVPGPGGAPAADAIVVQRHRS